MTLDARRGKGYVLVGWRRPGGEEVSYWSVGEFMRARRMKKKKKADSPATSKHLAPIESELFADMMPIVEHVAVTQYEDGDTRKVGRITFTTFGGVWQAEVKDPDTFQQMRLTAKTVDDLFLLLAVQLGSEDAPWEPDTWAMQQAKKVKK